RCHDQGMKGFKDTVRPALLLLPGRSDFDKRQALRLYPEQKEMDEYLKEDGERFQAAIKQGLGEMPASEPLTRVSRRYLEDPVHLTTTTGELGLREPEALRSIFRLPRFAALGLLPLAGEGAVRRDAWEDYHDQTVTLLGLGRPLVPLDGLLRRDFPAG